MERMYRLWKQSKGSTIDLKIFKKTGECQGCDLRRFFLTSIINTFKDPVNINLKDANLEGTTLKYADLRGANLTRANLWGANLSNANLYGAKLEGATLWVANLKKARLEHVYGLAQTYKQGANFTGAIMPQRD